MNRGVVRQSQQIIDVTLNCCLSSDQTAWELEGQRQERPTPHGHLVGSGRAGTNGDVVKRVCQHLFDLVPDIV